MSKSITVAEIREMLDTRGVTAIDVPGIIGALCDGVETLEVEIDRLRARVAEMEAEAQRIHARLTEEHVVDMEIVSDDLDGVPLPLFDRIEALIHDRDALSRLAAGGGAIAGVWETARAGDEGLALAGGWSDAISGDDGASLAGFEACAVTGDRGVAVSGRGRRATATAGDYGCAVVGDEGAAVVGVEGTALAGDMGVAAAGAGGAIGIWYYDGPKRRLAVGYIWETLDAAGEVLAAGVIYKLDDDARFVRVGGEG